MAYEKITNMPWWHAGQQIEKNAKYTINHDLIRPDHIIGTHWHDYIEFQIVTAGRGRMIFNGTPYLLRRGDVFVLSHFDCHRIESYGEGLRIFTINAAHGFVDEITSNFLNTSGSGIYCRLDEKELDYILFECNNLLRDMDSDVPVVVHSSKIALSNIAMYMLRKNTISGGRIPRKMQKITAYINSNFDKDMSLESIAKEFETSANYLGKQFKNLLGITYNDYINRVRMRYACTLIASSDMTIKEVAHAAGYSSTEYFYSVFKKNIGVTPRVYRLERIK